MVIENIGGKKKHGKIQSKMAYGLNKGGIFKGSKMFGAKKIDAKKKAECNKSKKSFQ